MDFIILILLPMGLGFWAQKHVGSTYNRFLQVQSRGRITGAEAARFVMQRAGIHDVDMLLPQAGLPTTTTQPIDVWR